MPIELLSTERISYGADCRLCGAGGSRSFNWPHAQKNPQALNLYVYEFSKKLRAGSLFKCKSCNYPWYLREDELFMYSVPMERLKLIEEWDATPVVLSPEHAQVLKEIGPTSSYIYDNDRQYRQTPCKVTTKTGEVFNYAIITQQEHAPFEECIKYRLASDVQNIQPSPFALSLEVRSATTQANEIRNGFAPTIVEKPNGQKMILNWTQNFYDRIDCLAADIKVVKGFEDWNNLPHIYHLGAEVTYFVADC